jgi:hypothetical protein
VTNEPASWPVTCLQELQWQIAEPRGRDDEGMERVYEAKLQWQWNLRVMSLLSTLVSGMLLAGTREPTVWVCGFHFDNSRRRVNETAFEANSEERGERFLGLDPVTVNHL